MIKKWISLLIFFLINSVWAETMIHYSSELFHYDDYRGSPEYYVTVSSPNEWVFVNNFYFVKEGTTLTVNHKDGDVYSTYHSQTVQSETCLYIDDQLIKEDNYSFKVEKDKQYTIRISIKDSKGYIQEYKILAMNSDALSNKDIPLLANYNGFFASYEQSFEGKRYQFSSESEKIKLTFEGNNLLASNGEWHCMEDSTILITYIPVAFEGSDYEGYGEVAEQVSFNHVKVHTKLLVNGIEQKDKEIKQKAQKISSSEPKMKIELRAINEDSTNGGESTLYSIELYVHSKDEIRKPNVPSDWGDVKWTNEDQTVQVEVDSNYGDSLTTFYEYLVKNEGESIEPTEVWNRGNSCKVSASNGNITKKIVYFRVANYFGNKTDCVSKRVYIDKERPTLNTVSEWQKDSIQLEAKDNGSGIDESGFSVTKDEYKINLNGKQLSETGVYVVKVKDIVGNTSSDYIYKIDKDPPVIEMKLNENNIYVPNNNKTGNWTNNEVTITVSDAKDNKERSGIYSFYIGNQNIVGNTTKWNINGDFAISVKDNAGNCASSSIYFDKEQPEINWKGYSQYEYVKENEKEILNSLVINYNVKEEYSKIKNNGNILFIDEIERNKCSAEDVHYKLSDLSYTRKNEKVELERTSRKVFKIKINVTDNAGNSEKNTEEQTLTIPSMVNIEVVEKDNINKGIKRTYLDGDTVKVGILLNKIDFSDYKSIKLKRTFLGDKFDGTDERSVIGLEEYKKYYAANTDSQYIENIWDSLQESYITENDVQPVVIDGIEYWYFEDSIEKKTGMGHRGICYQPEWEWKLLPVIERGNFTVIDKTANSPGKITIRLQGVNEDGKTLEYIELDSNGNSLSEKTMDDFVIPIDNMVPISFKIDDVDFDTYDIQITQYSEVDFINEQTGKKETVLLPSALSETLPDGYVQKTIHGNEILSRYREANSESEWYQFIIPDIEVSSEPPLMIKITMIEGCKGDKTYKDVTQSNIIKLQAGKPKLGGFSLNINEGCEYKNNIISSQPYKNINLSLIEMDEEEKITQVIWDFGDNETSEDLIMNHAYKQSSERKGDTSNYVLKINCIQGGVKKFAEVNVNIIDTQKGTLLGPEVWIGKHIIKNRIQVCDTSLKILNNVEYPENPTIVLAMSSMLENGTGIIDVFGNSKNNNKTELIINGETAPIILTEGKHSSVQTENGIESDFIEIQSAFEGGTDESLKWGGINAKNGANININNAKIKYAIEGLTTTENTGDVKILNTEIMYCAGFGLSVKSKTDTENLAIKDCSSGVFIDNKAELNNIGKIQITGVKEGIESNGILNTDQLLLNEVSERGIILNGSMIINEEIEIIGNGEIGLTMGKKANLFVSELSIDGFIKGIVNLGNINSQAENTRKGIITINNSSEYGIRNEGNCFGKELNINSIEGRGYIAGRGSNTIFNDSNIIAPEIGIHCIGNAITNFGLCTLQGKTYGIKMDQDDSGIPAITLLKGSIFDDFTIKWYDCSDDGGALTDDEIESRLTVNN